jgi:hypothetical protein
MTYREKIMSPITKIVKSIKNHGLFFTIKKILVYPYNIYLQQISRKKIFNHNSNEGRFTEIYTLNFWGNKESVSGSGSTSIYTENLRNKLPDLFKKYSTQTIFDAPCGDFNWMKLLLEKTNINYIGGDIVKALIRSNNINYKKDNIKFIHIDLIKDKFPSADLMICRDCLFHLSFEDTRLVLKNFVDSKIPYLLTTSHKNICSFKNKNILTGDFREIDLFSAPYSFDPCPIERIDDWIPPDPEREMCLWSREHIISALNAWKT